MAFLVETGAMVAGACSYVSVVECDTYMLDNGYSSWDNQDDEGKQAALRKAARYLDGHYRMRWKGQKVDPVGQPMEWPRINVKVADYEPVWNVNPIANPAFFGYVDQGSIPQRVKDAQCELAYRALSGDLAADSEASVVREKLDVIETQYAAGVLKGKKVYQVVDQLISDYITSSSSVSISRS